VTPEERSRLEYAYDRLYSVYDSGAELRPAEIEEMYRIYDALGGGQEAATAAPYEGDVAMAPPRADGAGYGTETPPEVDRFGGTAAYMAAPFMQSAADIMSTAGRRPTYFTDPVLGGAERVGQYVGDVGMAGLSALGGLLYGGAGLMGDVLGGTPQQERRLARDIAGGMDVSGVGPEARALGLLSDMGAGGQALRLARQPNQAPPSVGEAAAASYRVGGRLSPASDYTGPSGRPSQFSLPGGLLYDAKPINEIERAALEYMQRRGMDTSPMDQYPAFSEDRARLIAAAYDRMADAPTDPAVRRAYDAMVSETLDQYNALKNSGIDFKFLKPGMADPYSASPALGYQDLIENGRLWVFPTESGYGSDVGAGSAGGSVNPLLTRVGRVGDKDDAVANDAFRAVHDAFGHYGPGNPFFRRQGEERAFLEHSRMYSPEARGAMTTETRGQNSWLNSGPHGIANRTANTDNTVFADQKIGLMPKWTYDPTGMPTEDELRFLLDYSGGWAR